MLETTLEVVAQRGFEEASLAAIARKLGVTAPLLIYHFASKDNLWRESIELSFHRLAVVVESAVEDGAKLTGDEAFGTLIRRLVYYFAQHPELHRIISHEAACPGLRLDWLVEHHLGAVFAQIEAVYRRGAEEGGLKSAPADYAIFAILGAVSNYLNSQALVAALYPGSGLDRTKLDDYANWVVDICFNGLASDNTQKGQLLPRLEAAV
ncbi:MAG: TetR/AcrR family transcriptional regulator [Hyphomicrobiaceae bacterium]|jgi:TetR/AcrR family transcriptional regulator